MTFERDKEADLKVLADRVIIEELCFRDDCDGPSPGMSSEKRPFGNSDIPTSILELLGVEVADPDQDYTLHEEQTQYASDLYSQDLVPYIQRRWQELDANDDSKDNDTGDGFDC